LHRDISIGNVLIREDESAGLLCDLDIRRTEGSGARQKTGTRPFMAIELLEGASHNFMHDLESFFSVLYWICMHFEKDGKPAAKRHASARWCSDPAAEVAKSKLGTVAKPDTFNADMKSQCSAFHKPLLPVMESFRRAVFPFGRPRIVPSLQLYDKIKQLLREGAETLDRDEALLRYQAQYNFLSINSRYSSY
jgi:serine/threonine protein kinase